ncbi:MAG: DUF1573 domain-containing protein [Bacteroidetes bacterium]|nr:MAG: DUF1573 domain-containing protein [Bacteroidota bacterium]
MKNILFTLFSALLMVGMVACQTSGSAESKAAADNQATAEATQKPAAEMPPKPAKPEWQAQAEDAAKTTVTWAEEEYNYGTVASGTKVTHRFKFTNTGSEPLTLTRVKASCGCTTPSYSTEAVAPGEEGFIDVAFNTTGKSGRQTKTISVTGNFEDNITKVLRITGEVSKPAQ